MRVAISTDGDNVSAHFGRCPSFTIVDIVDGKAANTEIVDNPGHEPGRIPEFLRQRCVECIIAGGMGQRAVMLFENYGIEKVVGISGTVHDTIDQICSGTLKGGESLCKPGAGKGYGQDKAECDHPDEDKC